MEQKRGNAMMARFVAEVAERPRKWRTRGYGTVDGNMPWPKDPTRDLRLCSTSLKNVGNRGEWSVEEHEQFLKGLQEVGDGDWTGISREFVTTRTPTQVETHALLVFSYQNQTLRRRISTVVAETVKTSLQVAEATVRKIGDSIIPPSYNLPDSSGSHIISLASDKEDNPMHQRRVTSTEWIFIYINFCLEVLSASFDQISSPRKPDFALFGLLFSVVAVFACIWELILKGMTERIVLKRWRMVWWFYYPPPQSTPFGTFTDFFGLTCAITQCMVSAVQYAFLHSHVDNPIKVTILPIIFLVCLAASAIIRNQRYTNTINDHSL